MSEIELSAGTIEYQDTGGDRAVVVLLHGLMMDGTLWEKVVADLAADHRCIVPTLPLGAHRHAMDAHADLSLRGMARLFVEFLDRLDPLEVTLVGKDTGGALVQLLIGDGAARIGQVVLPPATRSITSRLQQGRLVEIPDSYTLIPFDQPAKLAQLIRKFTHESNGS